MWYMVYNGTWYILITIILDILYYMYVFFQTFNFNYSQF